MQRYRLPSVLGVGVVIILTILALASLGSTSSRAEEPQAELQFPVFQPTPTMAAAPERPVQRQNAAMLFQDSFDTAASLSSWTIVDVQPVLPGDESIWRVVDGHLIQDRAAPYGDPVIRDTMALTGDASWADYTITAQAYDQDNATVGLIARQNGTAFYRLRLFADGTEADQKLLLEKVDNQVVTVLAQAEGPGYQHHRWYTIALQVRGNQLTASVDGQPVLSATDASLTAGRAGVTTVAFGGVHFDSVSITTP